MRQAITERSRQNPRVRAKRQARRSGAPGAAGSERASAQGSGRARAARPRGKKRQQAEIRAGRRFREEKLAARPEATPNSVRPLAAQALARTGGPGPAARRSPRRRRRGAGRTEGTVRTSQHVGGAVSEAPATAPSLGRAARPIPSGPAGDVETAGMASFRRADRRCNEAGKPGWNGRRTPRAAAGTRRPPATPWAAAADPAQAQYAISGKPCGWTEAIRGARYLLRGVPQHAERWSAQRSDEGAAQGRLIRRLRKNGPGLPGPSGLNRTRAAERLLR